MVQPKGQEPAEKEPEKQQSTSIISGTAKLDMQDIEKTVVIPSAPIPSMHDTQQVDLPDGKKKSLTASFLTGALRIFDRTQDVDKLVSNSVPPPSDQEVETEAEDPVKLAPLSESFKKGETIAAGGQGILYRGMDMTLNRQVAIKSLRPQNCGKARERHAFIAEARVTAQLEHPSIVPVYSLHSEENNGLSVTMKMIRGRTLQSYLNRIKILYRRHGIRSYDEKKALRVRLEILLKICDALEYAHSRNVMHCDLKPENIMIGEYHEAYLMDWGISHPIKGGKYDPKTWIKNEKVLGTPRFLSPETLRGEYCDERADIYAMGLILYEIVTLNEAFTGESAEEIIENVRHYRMNPVKHQFRYSVDPDLKAIILKAAAYDAEDRYFSIKAFAGDIRKFLRSEEVSARPDNFIRKIFRFCIVRHGKAMVITALICLLAAVGSVATQLLDTIQRERRETQRRAVIGRTFISGLVTSYNFENEISNLENSIEGCSQALIYLLDKKIRFTSSEPDAASAFPIEMYAKKPPASFRYHTKYGCELDFDHIGYLMHENADRNRLMNHVQAASELLRGCQDIMLSSTFGTRLTRHNRNELIRDLMDNGKPVCLIYFAFEDGIYFCYPGKSYARQYDPRKRLWYRNRINPANPSAGWSTPYLNAGETGLVITYSVRLETPDGKAIGVAAVDVDLSFLQTEISRKQNRDETSIVEKTFVDETGSIIITTNKELNKKAVDGYLQAKNGGAPGFPYPDQSLIRQFQLHANGYLQRIENGKTYIYVYSKCKTVNWLYFEKIDLDEAMKVQFEPESMPEAMPHKY